MVRIDECIDRFRPGQIVQDEGDERQHSQCQQKTYGMEHLKPPGGGTQCIDIRGVVNFTCHDGPFNMTDILWIGNGEGSFP